jgi:hypothetical protein
MTAVALAQHFGLMTEQLLQIRIDLTFTTVTQPRWDAGLDLLYEVTDGGFRKRTSLG